MRSVFRAFLPTAALLASIAEAAHYTVTVGKGGLKFDPENLVAAPGDTVEYQFFAKKHSVVQSSFAEPCKPLAAGGFFSGFTPTDSPDTAARTTFTITVNDTKPIWAYCSQTTGDHCQNGMVHSINAPTSGTNTLDAFRNLAKAAAKPSTSPPDLLPVGGLRKLRVDVGLGGNLTFTPSNITELARTVVEFSFNPKNHSVVQSNFANPCQPLDQGFSSGFIPTAVSPSGALFDIVIKDNTTPIWFYCAQTNNNHCQKGMVGSINAPATGNTLQAFIDKATTAPPSTIPPQAPIGGTMTINGTVITSFNGAVFNPSANTPPPPADGNATVPSPGTPLPPQVPGMAGGGQPANYNWGNNMTDLATEFLQLLQFLDDILLEVLFLGHANLATGGAWAGVYPKSIVDTIGAMSAQALVHRSAATDCLQHFQKPLHGSCSYKLQDASVTTNVDGFLHAALTLLLLEIGLLTDISALIAAGDPWLVPILVTEVGAKSRMTAVVNMMQNHIAAAAPREVMIPAPLAWSYATTHYVRDCQGPAVAGMPDKTWPTLEVTATQAAAAGGGRTTGITVQFDGAGSAGSKYLAWVGPWGGLQFTDLAADGTASVPTELFGHVWIVVVSKKDGVKLQDLPGVTVAGPEILWVSGL
ncbi:hypothetical protein B0T17DRAFT_551741 [Bombardia bombarda]|uniref:Extracellular serine-rich protein n=1 Tax=Bombardia bombarda TaxID=252184 RepID=A0AA39XM50_9PEZI|nr:hypothetical protein B0T17DRAFT_551741 [Bombardia bombarda]